MGEYVDVVETGQIEPGAHRQELEAGVRLRRSVIAGQHRVEPGLQRVQMQHVGGGVGLLLGRQRPRRPVRALLLLRHIQAQQLAAEILQSMAIGIGPHQLGGDLGAVDGRRLDTEILRSMAMSKRAK